MAGKGRSIGATLVLREGNFFTNAKKAEEQSGRLGKSLGGATARMKEQGGAVQKLGGGMTSLVKKVAGAAAAYVGFRQAKDFVGDCVTGVMELERANNRLGTLMLNTKGNTQDMADGIVAYADQLELLTTIEGDATVAGASQLATFQLQGDNIKTLLPALQNLAAGQYGVNVTQDNMIQSANLLGKVMMGQTGALSKAGVSFTSVQEKLLKTGTEAQKTATLVEVLNQNFGGLAESVAKTDEGKVIQLRNAWGSVKDEVGFAVMPAVRGVVTYLAEHIPQIRDKVTGAIEAVSPYVQTAIGGIKAGCQPAGDAIGWVRDNWTWLKPVILGVAGAVTTYKAVTLAVAAAQKIATAAQWAFNAALTANPVGLVVVGIAALIAVGVALYKNWDKLKEKFPQLTGSVEKLLGAMKSAFVSAWNLIKTIFSGIWSTVQPVLEKLQPLFAGVWENIKIRFQAAWDNIKVIFQTAVDILSGLFQVWSAIFQGNWSGVWDAVKGIFSSVWNGRKGIFLNTFSALDQMTGGKLGAVAEKIMGIFGKVKGFVGGVWDSIAGFAKGAVNKIISVMNGLIGGVNKLQFDIPEWVPGLGGKKFGINIPTIPMLADGGVIRRPGTVLVGERGPELLNLGRGASVDPLPKGGRGNQNTFHITIYANHAEEGLAETVRRAKLILSTM